jgi:hypothetical protein
MLNVNLFPNLARNRYFDGSLGRAYRRNFQHVLCSSWAVPCLPKMEAAKIHDQIAEMLIPK